VQKKASPVYTFASIDEKITAKAAGRCEAQQLSTARRDQQIAKTAQFLSFHSDRAII